MHTEQVLSSKKACTLTSSAISKKIAIPLRIVHASKLAEGMPYFITTLPTTSFAFSSSANKGPFIWLQASLDFIIFKYFKLTQHIYSWFKETALIEDKTVTPVLCKNLNQASFNHPLKKNNRSLAFFLRQIDLI